MSFNHQKIEKKWQSAWVKNKASYAEDKGENSLYHLVMFPYPSGAGLHVGHVESYSAMDILTRLERMRGKNVLFPMGYDAFGLPAENYAIKTGVHPSETTKAAISNFRKQLDSIGLSFDWSREVSTADPDYYRWTQWLFLLFYKKGLAYRKKSPVNWCDDCHTVLANEQVVDGACDRCKNDVVQKELEQWFFKITDYADRLLEGLDHLDWPEKIKSMQRNWIGKSEGAQVEFKVDGGSDSITVFTTRPDTLFGATYMVLAPEHELVDSLTSKDKVEEIKKYKKQAGTKSALERTELQKDKTGVFTGSYAINPVNNEKIPVWVADYVMVNYGTGAIMAVPGHDERDFEFAKKYDLEIKQVVESDSDDECFKGEGKVINSDFLDGLFTPKAKEKIIDWLKENKLGGAKTTFRIRDWLVSRQRYWGAPIPIIWCDDCGAQAAPEDSLPVVLPTDVDFKPTGESPLVDSKTFHDVTCPKCDKEARRESDTMDTFVDSSWYYLRYTDPKNEKAFADKKNIDYWCPVDLYLGGAEHAVMHLLYSRFFAYALHDLGYTKFQEPFLKLRNQGLIMGPDGEKMSKSRGNVVNPDSVVSEYGADSIRIYEMFMGPLEDAKPWDTKGIVGVRRFLDKVWKAYSLVSSDSKTEDKTETLLHKTIKKVTEDFDNLKFNTAISQLMIMVNEIIKDKSISKESFQIVVQLLAPLAPHITEELWEMLGNKESIFKSTWPQHDPDKIVDDVVELGVQINGKVRGTIQIAPDAPQEDAITLAKAQENVSKNLDEKEIIKVVYVAGRILNIVVK
jgi:leucyl-tRNA synthetase